MDAQTDQKIRPRLVFLLPVWGTRYVDTFLDPVLPALLTDGNLPSLDRGSGAQFRILTTFHSAKAIAQARAYSDLRSILEVRMTLLDGLVNLSDPYQAMSDCYRIGMNDAPTDAYFVFLTADAFWSDGMVRVLQRRIAEGYNAVMVMGLRVKSDKFLRSVCQLKAERAEGLNGVSPNELVGIVLSCLHPMAETHNVLGSSFATPWPSNLYWIEPGQRLVAHGFHLHPLMVKHPGRASAMHFKGTIDTGFLESLRYPLDKFYIVRDSSEILGIDLTLEDREHFGTVSYAYFPGIVRWAMIHANKYHWHFFQHQVIFSAGGSAYDPTLEEARSLLVSKIMHYGKSVWLMRPAAKIVYKTKRWLGRVAIGLIGMLAPFLRSVRRRLG